MVSFEFVIDIILPYHFHVPIVWKYGNLNLLEPTGSVQACNGIALPLLYMLDVPNSIINSLLSSEVVWHKDPQHITVFLVQNTSPI